MSTILQFQPLNFETLVGCRREQRERDKVGEEASDKGKLKVLRREKDEASSTTNRHPASGARNAVQIPQAAPVARKSRIS